MIFGRKYSTTPSSSKTPQGTSAQPRRPAPPERPPELTAEQKEWVESCIVVSDQLLEVLREESEALRRFDSEELMGLLPRKEYFVKELHERIGPLKEIASEKRAPKDDRYELLKNRLKEIDRCNRDNRVFVEGTLDFWRDLLAILSPSSYSRGQTGNVVSKPGPYKGISFHTEI
jgi:flagellar biosynthesis/type III secretory pathway chaperone